MFLDTLNTENSFSFSVDIEESESDYRVQADMPGVKKADIYVSVENGCLTVSAEKKSSNARKQAHGFF